jgi:hypothetical protein
MPDLMLDRRRSLLAIVELGGYPNLTPLYRKLGFELEVVNSQRKAQAALKRRVPDVVVAEYNFQSDFRDRTSNLETLMARLQRNPEVKVICFYQPEHSHKLSVLTGRFSNARIMPEASLPPSNGTRLPSCLITRGRLSSAVS